jgi:FtsH-binding integral membrane protein
MSYLIAIAFVCILASLAFAMFYMVSNKKHDANKSKNMATALTWRITLSVALFLAILVFWKMGFIKPTGIVL